MEFREQKREDCYTGCAPLFSGTDQGEGAASLRSTQQITMATQREGLGLAFWSLFTIPAWHRHDAEGPACSQRPEASERDQTVKHRPSIRPLWVPSKAEPETKTWVQVVYLKVDPKKQENETGKEKKLIKDAQLGLHPSGNPLRNCVKLMSELSFLQVRGLGHLSDETHPSPAEDYSWECFTYLFLLPGCVDIFGLQKTFEAEEQEPLSLALEVELVVVHVASCPPQLCWDEKWGEGM